MDNDTFQPVFSNLVIWWHCTEACEQRSSGTEERNYLHGSRLRSITGLEEKEKMNRFPRSPPIALIITLTLIPTMLNNTDSKRTLRFRHRFFSAVYSRPISILCHTPWSNISMGPCLAKKRQESLIVVVL
jgi:hypothetical protein